MTRAEQLAFYQDARQVRDLDDMTIDMIMKAEFINIDTATIMDCKQAIIKYQYISHSDPWKWTTKHEEVLAAIKESNPPIPLF